MTCPIRVLVTDTLLQVDDLPKLSPPSGDESDLWDAGPEGLDSGVPRLWEKGDTPRGLKEREQRKALEQLKLMGVPINVDNTPVRVRVCASACVR